MQYRILLEFVYFKGFVLRSQLRSCFFGFDEPFDQLRDNKASVQRRVAQTLKNHNNPNFSDLSFEVSNLVRRPE